MLSSLSIYLACQIIASFQFYFLLSTCISLSFASESRNLSVPGTSTLVQASSLVFDFSTSSPLGVQVTNTHCCSFLSSGTLYCFSRRSYFLKPSRSYQTVFIGLKCRSHLDQQRDLTTRAVVIFQFPMRAALKALQLLWLVWLRYVHLSTRSDFRVFLFVFIGTQNISFLTLIQSPSRKIQTCLAVFLQFQSLGNLETISAA